MQKNQNRKINNKEIICTVAGGSGGHITPALVISDKWKKEGHNRSVLFVGNSGKLDKKILKPEKIEIFFWLRLINFPGKKIWLFPVFLTQFFIAFFKSLKILKKEKPCKIISTGGLIAIPTCLAGFLLKIPIELYELNAKPGKAVKLLSFFAKDIFIIFEKTKFFFVGAKLYKYPIRFCEQDKKYDKKNLIKKIVSHFKSDRKTLFVLGGSQGSIFLNKTIKKWIENSNSKDNIQIIHQIGFIDKTNWKKFYEKYKIPAHIFLYNKEIKDFYLISDLVLCRGGAGTLFELEFFEKKALVVPIKNCAGNHQTENAIEMSKIHPNLFTVCDQRSVERELEGYFTTPRVKS
jgi:UDP-N-acetylglucosamine--N-acetylmuramyl-(pentapeptide) pyrophosphoryl-undecaprenol N-acetylglucosamine transferase